jgi:putative transposase
MRARIVLAAADGMKNKEIIAKYAVTADTARLWRNRWVKLQDIWLDDLSLAERLEDAPRPGAPAKITADQRCQIEALACEKPENSERPIAQWSAREIADEVIKRESVTEISPRHAARLLKRR